MELKGDTFESDDGSCYVLDFGNADGENCNNDC
jgi:hypothetical protein